MVNSLKVRIWRSQNGGKFRHYTVARLTSQTVLDIVTHVQRHIDPTLSYRFACRVGMCGSCAMTVNGIPRWTCRTHVEKVEQDGHLTIEPLRNLPVIRDLAVDMSAFFQNWQRAGGRFAGTRTRQDPIARIDPHSPPRQHADAAIQCINCAVCHAACDTVSWHPGYVGPAALNRAWSLHNDIRHGARAELHTALRRNGGCFACHTQAGCTAHCPVGLDPARAIAGLKAAMLPWKRSSRP